MKEEFPSFALPVSLPSLASGSSVVLLLPPPLTSAKDGGLLRTRRLLPRHLPDSQSGSESGFLGEFTLFLKKKTIFIFHSGFFPPTLSFLP